MNDGELIGKIHSFMYHQCQSLPMRIDLKRRGRQRIPLPPAFPKLKQKQTPSIRDVIPKHLLFPKQDTFNPWALSQNKPSGREPLSEEAVFKNSNFPFKMY